MGSEGTLGTDPFIGQKLGHYRLEKSLGQGGFGLVYQATDLGLDRLCAVKLLNPLHALDPEEVARFNREAKLAASLSHENIVTIYTVGEQDGLPYLAVPLPYFAMELLAGCSLRTLLDPQHRLPLARALRLLGQMADALDYAHAHEVVHRDVKPENTFVSPEDHVTLVDFGLGRGGKTGSVSFKTLSGTVSYVAPELWTADWEHTTSEQRQSLGETGDRYALGVVAFEMLCGRCPFVGATVQAVMAGHVQQPPPNPLTLNPELQPAVARVLVRQLAKNPAQRYPSAKAFVTALATAVPKGDAIKEPRPKKDPLPKKVLVKKPDPPPVVQDPALIAELSKQLAETRARRQKLENHRKGGRTIGLIIGGLALLFLFGLVAGGDPVLILPFLIFGVLGALPAVDYVQKTKEIARLTAAEAAIQARLPADVPRPA